MYKFWYDHLKNKYNNRVELIYTDTDSFIIQVETNDIYKDMLEDKNLYDFSEYPKDHPNFYITNKKVLGKFKDEMKSLIITEFIGLKLKMYSFNYIDSNIKINENNIKYDEYNNIILNNNVQKGVKYSISLKHDEYKRSLYKEKLIY